MKGVLLVVVGEVKGMIFGLIVVIFLFFYFCRGFVFVFVVFVYLISECECIDCFGVGCYGCCWC